MCVSRRLFNTTALTAVRVYYTLQVSPAPAVATFTDVPTSHPFFQFVEVLVGAGIAAGCAPALYCVNSPITRGEMAVFLSKALGLHFAP
jgi:S-layer homology domain